MIEIEDDEGGDAYVGKEGMSASVIAGRDASLVFEFSEHAFDLVALAVECFAYVCWVFRCFLGGMQGVVPREIKAARNSSLS